MAKERCVEVTIEEVEMLCDSDIDEEASDSEEDIDFLDDSSTSAERDDIIFHKGVTFKSIKSKKIKDYDVKNRILGKSLANFQSNGINVVNSTEKKSDGFNAVTSIEKKSDGINVVDSIGKKPDVKKNKESTVTSTNQKNKGLVYACMHEGCEMVFSRPSRLTQHIRTHTGERPYVCPALGCSQSYTRQQHLKRHTETVHQSKTTEEKLKCEKCDKYFSNVYSLKKHDNRYHLQPRFKCGDCGQTFKKQHHLRTHSYMHTGIKPYKCEFPGCDLRFGSPSRLKRHSMVHEKNRYACPQESCQQTFDRYKDLQQHLSCSHPKVCDICGRTFRQLRRLKIHRVTHENVREAYFCPIGTCDKYFYQENNLNSHIKTKHDQVNIYECGVCSKRLSTKQKLMHHTTTHGPSYKRNFVSEKPRKPRKDKGTLRRDLPRLLSGYYSDEEHQKVKDSDGIVVVKVDAQSQCHKNLRELVHDSLEEMDADSNYQETLKVH